MTVSDQIQEQRELNNGESSRSRFAAATAEERDQLAETK